MSKTNYERYVTGNQSAGFPIVSLVCTCLAWRREFHQQVSGEQRLLEGIGGWCG
jgi:hypothetical protein